MSEESILSIDDMDRYHRYAMELVAAQEYEQMDCSSDNSSNIDDESEKRYIDLEEESQTMFDNNLWGNEYNSSSDSDWESESESDNGDANSFYYRHTVAAEIPELVCELDGQYWNT